MRIYICLLLLVSSMMMGNSVMGQKRIIKDPIVCFDTLFYDIANLYNDTLQQRVYFRNVTIEKKAFFNMSVYKQYAYFDSLALYDSSFFSYSIFQENIYFKHNNFKKRGFFNHSDFQKDFYMDSSAFLHGADFSSSTFQNNFEIFDINFMEDTHQRTEVSKMIHETWTGILTSTSINYSADFGLSTFVKDASFVKLKFQYDASFLYSNFFHDVSFSVVTFQSNVDFAGVRFQHIADFGEVEFGPKADFTGLTLSDSTDFNFYGAKLPDTLDFSNNRKIPQTIDLSNADFSNGQNKDRPRCIYLCLYGSDISKFKFDYLHFKLLFISPLYHDTLTTEERETIYEAALLNFKTNGQQESYERLDKEYQQFRHPVLGWLLWAWWDYSYKKQLVFLWTAIFMFVFTLITYRKLEVLNFQVYELKDITMTDATTGTRKIVAGSRWYYAFIYTAVIFFSLALKIDKLKFKDNKMATLYLLTVYALGLVCLAYMANFVLQK